MTGAAGACPLSAPQSLSPEHDGEQFECGLGPLDDWLKRHAVRNEAEGAARTYVVQAGRRVVGYYSLAAGSLIDATATGRIRRNMPNPVPGVLLGRVAIDRRWQGIGLGADLLRDAVLRTAAAAGSIGVRAMLVRAISDQANAFHEKHGFRESPVEPMTLMMTVAEAKRLLAE